jgi:hypothetical protein
MLSALSNDFAVSILIRICRHIKLAVIIIKNYALITLFSYNVIIRLKKGLTMVYGTDH